MNRLERQLYVELKKNNWVFKGEIARNFYKDKGISAKLLESVYGSLEGKLKSLKELTRTHLDEITRKIDAKAKQISDKEKKKIALRKRRDVSLKALGKGQETLVNLRAKLDASSPEMNANCMQHYKSELGNFHSLRASID